jgi:DNA helicase-2/ATP-dependent DNA helicase PcrA
MTWQESLTDEQLSAVTQAGCHARLLAGPGTGKTLCLTRRVIRLIEDQSVAPGQILIITFTRGAQAELRGRILAALLDETRLPRISTFHSYALRVLMTHPAVSQLPRPLRISDDWEDRQIIEEELKAALNLETIREARRLLSKLSADWETLTADSTDWETHFPNPPFLGAWREHRKVYGYTLRAELVYNLKHAIDEGQLENFVPPRNLVVDEYQDLNACDLAVIRNLTQRGAELYCAGDDDQSIYGFRFASPDGIRRFAQDYSPSEQLDLIECKRCDRKVLEFALFVAAQDPRRIPKKLAASKEAGEGEVHVLRFGEQQEEAAGVAAICAHLVRDKGLKPGGILVLLRSDRNNAFSRPIKFAITEKKLQVAVGVDPLAPLNEDAGRSFLSLLRLVDNPRDNLAWRSLLQARQNGIGLSTLAKVYELARSQGTNYIEALGGVRSTPGIIGAQGPALVRELEAINVLIQSAGSLPQTDLLHFAAGVADLTITDATTKSVVLDLVGRAIALSSPLDLGSLLRSIQTSLGDAEAERDPEKISIMTMHQAKGLTADAVLVVGAEDERIPGDASGGDLDDERRLLYVSLSRARHFVYVTYCNRRTGSQSYSGSTPGRRVRALTQFLRDGPASPEDGPRYLRGLERAET